MSNHHNLTQDTFKMRERKNHHIVVTVTQSNSSALILERCCGVFLAPGDSNDPDNYMLLDMPLGSYLSFLILV